MGSSFCTARLQRGWKSHAKEKLTGNSATMLLKRNEFKKKQKKLKISLDNKIESGIHLHSWKSAPRIIRGVLLFRPRIFSCLRHRRRLFCFWPPTERFVTREKSIRTTGLRSCHAHLSERNPAELALLRRCRLQLQ